MTLPLKLIAYTASATLLLLCLYPLLVFAGDAVRLGPGLFEVVPDVSLEPGGRITLRLILVYNGNIPLTDFTVTLRARCGGVACAEASSNPATLVRGASSVVEARVPPTAEAVEVVVEGKVGGLYRLRARQEVSLGVVRG
ncbi:hypothetical protein IG193_00080 [Infirmifilum lucidum]|uniref:Uncharacterized protein n=1 Tax=Infirmifilum lucidum TaxID=2776706 RepID=A0A7L9FHR5_9CREN|nr:hypothetical protein [Infirmifilum lucidum]QOJ78902.1 hypothetical protein IG193_00080 [Infirmifilum lucidum]